MAEIPRQDAESLLLVTGTETRLLNDLADNHSADAGTAPARDAAAHSKDSIAIGATRIRIRCIAHCRFQRFFFAGFSQNVASSDSGPARGGVS